MKLTKSKLKQIIKEEIQKTLNEGPGAGERDPTRVDAPYGRRPHAHDAGSDERVIAGLGDGGPGSGYNPYRREGGEWYGDYIAGPVPEEEVFAAVYEQLYWSMTAEEIEHDSRDEMIGKVMELYKSGKINPFDMDNEEKDNFIDKLRPQMELPFGKADEEEW